MGLHLELRTLGSLAWMLLVLLSWIGWGTVAAQWAAGRHRLDAGLCAAWGMALTAIAGGVFNAFQICSKPLLGAMTVAGAAIVVPRFSRTLRRLIRRPAVSLKAFLPLIPPVLMGGFILIAGLSPGGIGFNVQDDLPFYIVMPLKMLQTGAAIDPLNGRRLSTFGGFAFLHAQAMVGGTPWNAWVVDIGLSGIVLVMTLVGIGGRPGRWRWTVCFLGALCWFYPVPRANVTAAVGITALLLGLLRTVHLADRHIGRRLRLLILAAITATAACTFRDNILALPPVFFALYFGHRWWRMPAIRPAVVREAMIVAATGAAALMPWSIALHRACGSFLFPLMKGNQRDPYFAFVLPGTSVVTQLMFVGKTLTSRGFLIAYLPVLFIIIRKQWTALYLFVGTLIMSAVTAFSFTLADPFWIERFCIPALLAPAIYGVDLALRPARYRHKLWWAAIATMVLVAVVLQPVSPVIHQISQRRLSFFDALTYSSEYFAPGIKAEYAAMQQAVPPGATIATALDYPPLLDFARNPIDCIDVPGGASKVGLWPFRQGPVALKRFLAAQGVDYVAYYDFRRSEGFYPVSLYLASIHLNDRAAPLMLDMMNNLTLIGEHEPVVYRHNGYVVFKVR